MAGVDGRVGGVGEEIEIEDAFLVGGGQQHGALGHLEASGGDGFFLLLLLDSGQGAAQPDHGRHPVGHALGRFGSQAQARFRVVAAGLAVKGGQQPAQQFQGAGLAGQAQGLGMVGQGEDLGNLAHDQGGLALGAARSPAGGGEKGLEGVEDKRGLVFRFEQPGGVVEDRPSRQIDQADRADGAQPPMGGVVNLARRRDDVVPEFDDVVEGVEFQAVAVLPQLVGAADGEMALVVLAGPQPAVVEQFVAEKIQKTSTIERMFQERAHRGFKLMAVVVAGHQPPVDEPGRQGLVLGEHVALDEGVHRAVVRHGQDVFGNAPHQGGRGLDEFRAAVRGGDKRSQPAEMQVQAGLDDRRQGIVHAKKPASLIVAAAWVIDTRLASIGKGAPPVAKPTAGW